MLDKAVVAAAATVTVGGGVPFLELIKTLDMLRVCIVYQRLIDNDSSVAVAELKEERCPGLGVGDIGQ